jgi:hypothetical protein
VILLAEQVVYSERYKKPINALLAKCRIFNVQTDGVHRSLKGIDKYRKHGVTLPVGDSSRYSNTSLEAFAQQQQKSKYKQIVHDANVITISFYAHSLYAVNSILLKVMLLRESMGDLRSSLHLALSSE